MTLKDIELAMAEDIDPTIRSKEGLLDRGLIIIETTNTNLKAKFKMMPKGGIREYLLTFGKFKDIELKLDD